MANMALDKDEMDRVCLTGSVLATLVDRGLSNDEIQSFLQRISGMDHTVQANNLRADKDRGEGRWFAPKGVVI